MSFLPLLALLFSSPAGLAQEPNLCASGDSAFDCRAKVQLAFESLKGNHPANSGSFKAACLQSTDDVACGIYALWIKDYEVDDPKRFGDYLNPEVLARLEKTCEKKDGYACYVLARAEADKGTVGPPAQKRAQLLKQACGWGNHPACESLAAAYLDGFGAPVDKKKALAAADKSCTDSYPAGCAHLGFVLLKISGAEPNRTRALEIFSKACEQGSGAGCNGVGWMEENGYATKPSSSRAEALFELACKLGHGHGCKNLGGYREQAADRGEASLAPALELYLRSCALGFGGGCWEVGRLYQYGKGVALSEEKAFDNYRRGCDRGDAQSCRDASRLLRRRGLASEAEQDQALELLRDAILPGNVPVIQKLAE